MDNLRYIRETMERASAFTAVPVGPGGDRSTALVAAYFAWRQTSPTAWLEIWIVEGIISLLIAGWDHGSEGPGVEVPLLQAPGKRSHSA